MDQEVLVMAKISAVDDFVLNLISFFQFVCRLLVFEGFQFLGGICVPCQLVSFEFLSAWIPNNKNHFHDIILVT